MKKVKVKTKQKQKQKQSQTVNINLGNVLKKSKPRRKPQPKAQPNISQPITFNAPPIREYVDTSLYNIPSRTENPLLARSTTTPIPDTPVTINPTSNTVGPIQNNNPLFTEPVKPKSKSILEPEPVLSFEELINRTQSYYENNDIETQKELARQNYIREQNILNKKKFNNQLKKNKQKIDIGPSIKITPNQPSASLSQSNIPSFYKLPEQPKTIISAPEEPKPIDQGISRANTVGPILNKFPVFQEKPSITSALPQTETILSPTLPQESITSSYNNEPSLTEEEITFNREITKAPTKKRPPSEEGKKIVARPIKVDPNTGEAIKKPKKQKQNVNLVIQEPPV